MNKVVEQLEKNVQWIAVGLGILYVIWMAWTYLVTPPVMVQVDGQRLSPGEVDPYVVNNAATELEGKMRDSRVPTMRSPRWVDDFVAEMNYKDQPAGAFARIVWPVDRTVQQGLTPIDGPRRIGEEVFVEALPEAPQPLMEAGRAGMSTVVLPEQIAEAPEDPAVAPVQPVVDQAQPGRDILWVTYTYRIPMAALAAAFRAAKLPPADVHTTVLEVEMEREEQLADGSWGKLTKVRPLPTVQYPPLPPENAPLGQKNAFLEWAKTHPVDIMQPPFYTVQAGDSWAPPGEPAGQIQQQQPQPGEQEQFDPAKWVDANLEDMKKAGLTQDQIRQVAIYKQKLRQEEAKRKAEERKGQRGGSGSGPGLGGFQGGGGAGGPGGGRFGMQDDGRGGFIDPGSFEDPASQRRGDFQLPPDESGMPGAAQPPEQQAPNMANFPIPGGEFDPRLIQEDAIGWQHDDTVEAGKTYRYRVRYRIKSPVWNTTNMTRPAELAATFAIQSEFSDWSEPITVPSLSSFWVVRANFTGDRAQIQVFRWHGGQLRTKTFDVAPGDAVGVNDNGIDFSTGWTMVDMRVDPRNEDRYVVLMDPNGRLHNRDFRTDTRDPEYQKRAAEAAAAAAAAPPPEVMAGTR